MILLAALCLASNNTPLNFNSTPGMFPRLVRGWHDKWSKLSIQRTSI